MRFSTFHSFTLTHTAGRGAGREDVAVDATPQEAIQQELERVRWAEELGFDGVWLREHHFTDYGFLPNTMVMAAHIAAMTRRIRIGSGIVTLPLHHPVRAVEDAALVDVLSRGRLDYGIGRGYQSVEFQGLGVPIDESRERCDEAIDLIIKLWTQSRVTHHGVHYHVEDMKLQPKPVQQPHPPVYYAAISRDSVVHYAEMGIPFIVDSTVTMSTLEGLASAWREAVAQRRGNQAPGVGPVAMRTVWVAPTNREARAYVEKAPQVRSTTYDPRLGPVKEDGSLARGYEYWRKEWHGRRVEHYDPAESWENRWVAGDIDRVIEGIKRVERMGYTAMIVGFGSDPAPIGQAETRRRMELFAREIMPHFKKVALTRG